MKVKHALAHATFFVVAAANAQGPHVGNRADNPALPAAKLRQSHGEVQKVALDDGEVMLRHAPLVDLGRSEMTVVFNIADRGLLNELKRDDKVRITAFNPSGTLVVSAIERTTQRR